MTLRRIGEDLAYWMDRLRIGHWNVSYSFASQADLRAKKKEFLYATILISPVRDAAKILIFRRKDLLSAQERLGIDLLDGKSFERTYEEAVIHELLHVRLDPREELAGDQVFETGIDIAAAAYYELRHGLCPQ